jgi:hypothetical protein
MAEAAAGAAPQRRSRLHDRLAGWWSHWLGRHAPLMDDPGLGRLDRFDGVAPDAAGSGSPARSERLGGPGTASGRPGTGAR